MANYSVVATETVDLDRTDWSTKASYDAVLLKSNAVAPEFKLVIKLRIRLQQVNKNSYSISGMPQLTPSAYDANHKAFSIQDWNSNSWWVFVTMAQVQANMWNDKFWLDPPLNWYYLDYSEPDPPPGYDSSYRPYIKCALEVDFNATDEVHKVIQVVRLDLDSSKLDHKPNSSTFRSHALLYDSYDIMPTIMYIPDWLGGIRTVTKYTIAHEIGHAIGLPHIGATRKLGFCKLAMYLDKVGFSSETSDFSGGQNAAVCYADFGPPDAIANIMGGGGSSFSKENALPWIWAIDKIARRLWRRMDVSDWTVLMKPPAAGNRYKVSTTTWRRSDEAR